MNARQIYESLRGELEATEASFTGWPAIQAWKSRAEPYITHFHPNHVEAFRSIVPARLPNSIVIKKGDPCSFDAQQRRAKDSQVATVKKNLLAFLDTLIKLSSIGQPPPPTLLESQGHFATITAMIGGSRITSPLKDIILADLFESQRSYESQVFKACVVMLGAALEGLMLGTLQRPDVISYMKTAKGLPQCVTSLGLGHPKISDMLASELTFDQYRQTLEKCVPGLSSLGVCNIQDYRNAIHPAKVMGDAKYSTFDQTRALHYITGFETIAAKILAWAP